MLSILEARNSGMFCPQGGYSRYQVIGMIEWGQKSKPRKNPFQQSYPEFPSHNNSKKELNDITRKIET